MCHVRVSEQRRKPHALLVYILQKASPRRRLLQAVALEQSRSVLTLLALTVRMPLLDHASVFVCFLHCMCTVRRRRGAQILVRRMSGGSRGATLATSALAPNLPTSTTTTSDAGADQKAPGRGGAGERCWLPRCWRGDTHVLTRC
jgi:hypothetical protein